MNFQFAHYNYNVMDLDKSIKFYEEALGLILEMARQALSWSLPG